MALLWKMCMLCFTQSTKMWRWQHHLWSCFSTHKLNHTQKQCVKLLAVLWKYMEDKVEIFTQPTFQKKYFWNSIFHLCISWSKNWFQKWPKILFWMKKTVFQTKTIPGELKFAELSASVGNFRKNEEKNSHLPTSIFKWK